MNEQKVSYKQTFLHGRYYQYPGNICIYRSSHLQVFQKIAVLEDFAKFTQQHLYWGPFLIKVLRLPACNLN